MALSSKSRLIRDDYISRRLQQTTEIYSERLNDSLRREQNALAYIRILDLLIALMTQETISPKEGANIMKMLNSPDPVEKEMAVKLITNLNKGRNHD